MLISNEFENNAIQAYAHNALLNVTYDDCIVDEENNEGINESWYALNYLSNNDQYCLHLSHDVSTIKYYFEPANSSYTWTIEVSETIADEIKDAYATSMKKWNNVYFYSYDEAGNVVKNKIINIVEGTAADHNLSIYPINSYIINMLGNQNFVAATSANNNSIEIESDYVIHTHNNEWTMLVNLDYFHTNNSDYEDMINTFKDGIGTHEFGHIFGLRDIDSYCRADNSDTHHNDLLMGYGDPLTFNITYQDIAGIAITRGFHTDDDHQWIRCLNKVDGKYKLICYICNGVKYLDSIIGIPTVRENRCSGNHELSGGYIRAVASYGNKDYYKCRACRFIAPFSYNVTQSYTYEQYSEDCHKGTNNIIGLNYTFLEAHSYLYLYYNNSSHKGSCFCGEESIQNHYIRSGSIINGRYAICLGCRAQLDLYEDTYLIQSPDNMLVTLNGSYILPNGVVVLVDEDIEAYMNSTLQFYNKNDLPVTE